MNSQIAITLLKDLEQSLDDYCELNDEGKTAFSMAITALELFGISEQLPSVQPKQKWETCFGCPLSHGCPKINGCTNRQTMEYASEVPDDCPISAQPRKGKWIEESEDWRNQITWWQCSKCGTPSSYKSNFCPNCGCRMEEGEQDEVN